MAVQRSTATLCRVKLYRLQNRARSMLRCCVSLANIRFHYWENSYLIYISWVCVFLKPFIFTKLRYKCPDFNSLPSDKCHYKGKLYEEGGHLFDEPSCTQSLCLCKKWVFYFVIVLYPKSNGKNVHGRTNVITPNDGKKQIMSFDCVSPQINIYPQESGEKCIKQFEFEKCEAVGKVCGEENLQKLKKCWWRGESYYEGERFNPNSDHCYQCVCNDHFDNSTYIQDNVKSCKRHECGIELYHWKSVIQGCAPVFSGEDACCPIKWKCRK